MLVSAKQAQAPSDSNAAYAAAKAAAAAWRSHLRDVAARVIHGVSGGKLGRPLRLYGYDDSSLPG